MYCATINNNLFTAEIGIALIQPNVTLNKAENLESAQRLIREAVAKYKPRIVTLPEFFNSPYLPEFTNENAEPIPDGETSQLLSALAKELNIYIVGGSIPEKCSMDIFNTTTVWSPEGHLICTYKKVRLFLNYFEKYY